MDRNQSPNKPQAMLHRIGQALGCAIPTLILCFILIRITVGSLRFNWGSLLLFLLPSALILLRLILLYRSKRSTAAKCVRGILWNVMAAGCFFFGTTFLSIMLPLEFHKVYQHDALEQFLLRENDWYVKSTNLMDQVNPGTPDSMELHRCRRIAAIFETDADILLCRYTPAEYAAEKAALEESLPYRAEPLRVVYYDERSSEQAAPTVCLGSDTFRFLDSGPDLRIPFYKTCAITVTNDETCEIAFIYYTDTEADGVESMREFLERECFWSWIR